MKRALLAVLVALVTVLASGCGLVNLLFGRQTTITISGNVTLPSTVAAGHSTWIGLLDSVPFQAPSSVASWVTSRELTVAPGASAQYSLSGVKVGKYVVVAFYDAGDNGQFDKGEPAGAYPDASGSTLKDFSGDSTVDVTINDVTNETAPAVPSGLEVTEATVTTLTINWTASAKATAYQLFRDQDAKGSFAKKVYDDSGATFTDKELTSGTTYYYKVQASNDSGTSPLSEAVSGTTLSTVGTIEGTVVDSVGGAPVAGATVAYGADLSTTTDSSGKFTFSKVPGGSADLIVSKAGMAGSKLQAVSVSDATTTKVEIVQTAYDHSSATVTPPTISVSGLEAGQECSGTIAVSVQVTGANPIVATAWHPSIYLRIGNTSGATLSDQTASGNSLSFSWNTSSLPPGDLAFDVVAYDNNNNRSELIIPVVIQGASGAAPAEVPSYYLEAWTTGASLQLFRTAAPNVAGRSYTTMSAAADSTVMVRIFVPASPTDAGGARIYRSSSQAGSYELVGDATFTTDSGEYLYLDASSALSPGQRVYYKISYFNRYGEGSRTGPIEVPLLYKYNLTLSSPNDYSVTASSTPTFTWAVSSTQNAASFGAQRQDTLVVRRVSTGTDIATSTVYDATSMAYAGPTLASGVLYEWSIQSVYVWGNSGSSSSVVSVAWPGTPDSNLVSAAVNGPWHFSVQP